MNIVILLSFFRRNEVEGSLVYLSSIVLALIFWGIAIFQVLLSLGFPLGGVASGKCGFTTLRKSKYKKSNFSVL